MARLDHRIYALMRALALAALLVARPAAAQPAPPAPPPAPAVTMPLAELDEVIRMLAEAPAKHVLIPLNILLEKRQRATAPAEPGTEPKAP